MTLIIRQAVRQDEPAVMRFLKEAYGPLAPYKGRDRWLWQFIDNPAAGAAGEPSVWIAVDAEKIVGQIALQRTQIASASRLYPAGWIVDVMVLASHRGLGLGHELYAAIARTGLPLLTLTMAPATRRMANALGAKTLPEVRQWTRIQRPRPLDIVQYLRERTQNRRNWRIAAEIVRRCGLTMTAAAALQAASRLRDRLRPVSRGPEIIVAPVTRFDASVDRIARSMAASFCLVPRSADHLNWRYVDCPQLEYQTYIARGGADVVGYLVLRQAERCERRLGFIVDCMAFGDDPKVWHALFAFGIKAFEDVAAIETAASTPVSESVLRELGFVTTRRLDPTIVCTDATVLEALGSQKNWFFNKGDHDWDQIHLAPSA